jgi:outer membrane protein OmpA-like peptidoglycan-associated protein/ABC-type amino acid transport substrate-binding protein
VKLTPLAKAFIALVVIGVVGYTGFHYYGDQIKAWSQGGGGDKGAKGGGGGGAAKGNATVEKDDFKNLGKPGEPDRDKGVSGVTAGNIGAGKLGRTLVVGINTWAGHTPGIIANGGLDPVASAVYKQKYGLDVKFVLIEDPAAKLNAFIKGDIDIMWDTVDSWAREASSLAEQNIAAKAIIQQDWSRGGDGIVSLKSIDSIEGLKGKTIATTRYTPSHWLLLYLLSQSGLSVDDKKEIEKKLVFTAEAPLAAAAFKAAKVDAAVTWEPDLSGAVKAREADAHVLVSTAAATNVIADCLVARQDVIDKAPTTLRDFVHGWFDGIDMIAKDPSGSWAVTAKALKLGPDDVSGMLSGLKLTPFADNALFFGLTGGGDHAQFRTLFDTAFIVWRKQGVISKAVDAKDYVDTRFVAALADQYQGQKVVEPFRFDPKEAKNPKARAIVNKSLSIYFTPGSDEIMNGSFFTLDSLGDTMTAFGNTFLRIEGNTDIKGSAKLNKTLSQKRADSVKKYLVDHFQIPETRFQTIGHGAEQPVASNETEAGRQLNRRTDIKVVLNAQ